MSKYVHEQLRFPACLSSLTSKNTLLVTVVDAVLLLAMRKPDNAVRAGEPAGPRSVSPVRHRTSSTTFISLSDIFCSNGPMRVGLDDAGTTTRDIGAFTSRITVGLDVCGIVFVTTRFLCASIGAPR